jgi:hypothetical protein
VTEREKRDKGRKEEEEVVTLELRRPGGGRRRGRSVGTVSEGARPPHASVRWRGPLGARVGMAAAAGARWWAVVLAVAVLLGPGRVVANTEGESRLI